LVSVLSWLINFFTYYWEVVGPILLPLKYIGLGKGHSSTSEPNFTMKIFWISNPNFRHVIYN
jgi:hypothetical protein